MPQQILLKRSATANKVPAIADLALGEVGINTYDGKMFIRKNNGTDSIVEIGNQVITGDATGSGNGAIELTLANTGVTAGAYGSASLVPVVTVDAKGRITAISTQAVASAAQAGQLSTARTIAATGDATWSVSFNGASNVSAALTLAASGVTAGTYGKVTVDAKGRVTAATQMAMSDITTALGYTPQNLAQKDTANGYAGLDATGKISPTQLPAIAISDTFVVATQAAMLALTAEIGDIAVRTDLSRSFILKSAGASTLANWQELLTPSDIVQSVNGMTGAVTLTTTHITEGTNQYYTNARASAAAPVQSVAGKKGAVTLVVADVTGAVNKAGDTMTGMLTLSADPTAARHAATKEYVDNALQVMDGGAF